MSSEVIVKAVLIRGPHEVAKKWSVFSVFVYCCHIIFALANNSGDFDQSSFNGFMLASLWGVLITLMLYRALENNNKTLMCTFGYLQIILASFYLIALISAWDSFTVGRRLCDKCNFNESGDNCTLIWGQEDIEVTKDYCDQILDRGYTVLLSVWICLHFLFMQLHRIGHGRQ